MKFRYKILTAIWGVVLSLLVITFFIINYWTRGHIEQTFSEELHSNYSTLRVLNGLQSEILIRGCLVIAESPRLRAVVELRDPKTAIQLSHELVQTTVSDLFMLTDRRGGILVQILDGQRTSWETSKLGSIKNALQRSATTDVWAVGGTIFRVASAPIMVGNELLGTLTLGFRTTKEDLQTLKGATNSDILLLHDQSVVLSTMGNEKEPEILSALHLSGESTAPHFGDTTSTIFTLATHGESFLGTLYVLNQPFGGEKSPIVFLLVKRIDEELNHAMAPILGTFGVVSILFLVLTTILGHFISMGITRPISQLVQGTTEISKGNYDYDMSVQGRDELSYLAEQFGEMSRSLKEKISELARVNRSLTERNEALDLTLQKLKEAQAELVKSERLVATGKLTAQLAHEINNPIHNIQSCLRTALNRLPNGSSGHELIEVAFEEINRMSKLTRQLLDSYRASLVPEDMKPLNLHEVLLEVVASSQEELNASGIKVSMDLQPDLSPIKASRDKLKQVFLNIVINARDAMPHGGTLRIASKREGDTVKIDFEDTGVGIPKESLNKIFDAFFTTKGKVSGVGLGLSVSYGIISQHGGHIKVESSVGEGSKFSILLPLESATVAMQST